MWFTPSLQPLVEPISMYLRKSRGDKLLFWLSSSYVRRTRFQIRFMTPFSEVVLAWFSKLSLSIGSP